MRKAIRLLGLTWACWLATAVTAAEPAPSSLTLRKIREAGVISIGYRDDAIPFSYLDDRQRPIGYSLDICRHIIEAVRQRLQLRELAVKWVPVTTATRIPLVVNETVDLECGVTTNNLERQKQVAFTVTTFVAESRLLSKRSAPVASLADLRGKSVVSTVGTTSIRYLPELNSRHRLDVKILVARDDAEAFRMVAADRAAAYAMDDVLLAGSIATAVNPGDYVISAEAISVEPYAIMLGKGDPQFKQLADEAITALYRSGEILHIYQRWLESPVPPRGIAFKLPMSEALKRAIARPTDSGDPAQYR